ncbi:MAG: hypothetical protein MAG551_00872 [Candidatus Scalindua arabica]|uniref:Uncharacterized protein n=1 Tax=Candidatus Scalindua arabica TaxID=1127984 RepID=A0A942A3F8_9BACT|nr:hypothetical protein [Candidatus Scalindua arabica]
MKKKRRPDKSDLEAIRDQILDFACTKHDFKLEKDDFLPEGDWHGVFIVQFKDSPEEDRLYCEAPLGESFFRFGLDLVFDEEIWEREHENISREAAGYDVALYLSPAGEKEGKRHCRIYSRAWIPNFSQRIFGLTLSNLMDCKAAVLQNKRYI